MTLTSSKLMLKRMAQALRFYDVGLNLTDPMYQGIYHGKKYHECDIKQVLKRAQLARVETMLLTGSSLHESREAIRLSSEYSSDATKLYYTLGVHPCCVNEFVLSETRSTIDNPTNDETFNAKLQVTDLNFTKSKLRELYSLIADRHTDDTKFRAIGEIGLDYDRFYYSSREMQLLFFEEQLKLSCFFPEIPLFLHMRNCAADFLSVMRKFVDGHKDLEDRFGWKEIIARGASVDYMPTIDSQGAVVYKFSPGRKFLVHSFTGSLQDMNDLLALSPNSFIGMNGCSLKTMENIECASKVPLDRLHLETDAPWCDIRRTHESYQYLFSNASQCNLAKDDPWQHGLSTAYPDLPQWFKSVKRDKLARKSDDELEQAMVKCRNEPCTMGHVATVIANVKGLTVEEVASAVWNNTCSVYGK